MSEATRLEEAAKHIKSAQKKLKRSLTKWAVTTADHDVAALEFENAAKIYQHLKKRDLAIEYWNEAATNHGLANSPFCKGRAYDSIALIYKDAKEPREVAKYTEMAAKEYLADGKPDKYAEALVRSAKVLRDIDSDEAAALVESALTTLWDEELFHLMSEPGRLLVAIHVKAANYLKAVAAVKQNLKLFQAQKQEHNINKGCIEVVVLHLARDDHVMAQREFRDISDEYSITGEDLYTCRDLIEAFEAGDPDLLKDVLGRQILTFLHPDIARLARKISISGAKAPAKASSPSGDATADVSPKADVIGDGEGDEYDDWK